MSVKVVAVKRCGWGCWGLVSLHGRLVCRSGLERMQCRIGVGSEVRVPDGVPGIPWSRLPSVMMGMPCCCVHRGQFVQMVLSV